MPKKSLFFGRFPQGEKGELQPIEWFVLKEENGKNCLSANMPFFVVPLAKVITIAGKRVICDSI